jgi:hypothetical protein
MAGPWLYSLSERFGYKFEIGKKRELVTYDNFRRLILEKKLGRDRRWEIAQHWDHAQVGDELFLYMGKKNRGIIGFATIEKIKKGYLDLKIDYQKTKQLLDFPISALIVRGWHVNLRRNIVNLEEVESELTKLLPWKKSSRGRIAQEDVFSISGIKDERKRIEAFIVQRQGQGVFRNRLLTIYQRKCAITGFDVDEALEASHIFPYRGNSTDVTSNGLLLRADIHTLLDLQLISIDPRNFQVAISKKLRKSKYANLAGAPVRLPQRKEDYPSRAALEAAWKSFHEKEEIR